MKHDNEWEGWTLYVGTDSDRIYEELANEKPVYFELNGHGYALHKEEDRLIAVDALDNRWVYQGWDTDVIATCIEDLANEGGDY